MVDVETLLVKLFTLVESSTDLESYTVPSIIDIEGELGPWTVHVVKHLIAEPNSDFHSKLLALIKQEGSTLKDVRAIVSDEPGLKPDVNLDLMSAIGWLVDKCC